MDSSAMVKSSDCCSPVGDDAGRGDPRGQTKYKVLDTLARLASQRAMNFAFLDQVLVSGGNFFGAVLLARAFGMYEFGRFALAWMLVEFIGSLQFAAIIQPMLNIGPKQAEADSDAYYHAVAAQQGAVCASLGILVWIGVSVVSWLFADPDLHHMAAPLCAAIVSYQLQSFFRRYFFARDRAVAALCNDALRFTIQIALCIALPVMWPNATAAEGLLIIAAACAVSAVQGAFFFGKVVWSTRVSQQVLIRHWEFSKWLLPSALMFWMTSQGFMVMSGLVLGAATTGGLKAAISIIGVLNILLLALDNFAPVQAARSLHVGGATELRRYIARLAFFTAALTVATVAALNIAPGYLVHVLYGEKYHGIDVLVRWLCAPAAVYGIGTVLVIWAAAVERTRAIFISYAVATLFTLIAAYPMTRYAGVGGVVLGSLLVELIRVALLVMALARWSKVTMAEERAVEAGADRATADRGP